MKKTVTLALTLALVLGLLSGCANNDTPLITREQQGSGDCENFTDEMKIPYAVDLSPEDGADSVERSGDHENSPYFAHPDVYNMESTGHADRADPLQDHAADQRMVLRRDGGADGTRLVRCARRLERRVSRGAAPLARRHGA